MTEQNIGLQSQIQIILLITLPMMILRLPLNYPA